jgi:type II secretory pathway component PulC
VLILVLAAAVLPEIAAVGVVVSQRPEACVAVLRSAGRTRLAGIGETAFGGRVAAIAASRVVLEFASGRLELRVAAPDAPKAPAAAPSAGIAGAPADVEPPPSYDHVLPRVDLEKRLAAELPRILAESALVPVAGENGVAGVRLVRIASGTLLSDLGLRPGDVLTSLNDTATDSLPSLLALWPRLQGESQIRAAVLREGRPLTLTLSLR